MLRKPTLYNKLAWPAGIVPGLDPNHMATGSKNLFLASAIASSGGFVNLLTGAEATLTGTTPNINSALGPNLKFTAATDVANYAYSTAVPTALTMAAIFNCASLTASASSLIQLSTASVHGIGILTASSNFFVTLNAVNVDSGIPFVANAPSFLAVSFNAGASNFVFANLATGAIKTAVVAGGTMVAGNGNIYFGNRTGARVLNGGMAAAMASPAFLSIAQLRQWAQDPWSFWYPRNIDLTQSIYGTTAAGSSFLAAWAQNSNLPVLGTGTY